MSACGIESLLYAALYVVCFAVGGWLGGRYQTWRDRGR